MDKFADGGGTVRRGGLLLIIAYLGFISLGLPDTVIGVAWPSVRDTFSLQQSSLALVFFAGGCSYFISSFSSGRLLGRFSVGTLLALSSACVAASALGYGASTVWPAFVVCAALHSLGSGAIDAGLNHYVAHHFSARHMNWLHACYSLGAMLGPLIMTAAIARIGDWRKGYMAVGGILLLLSVLFAWSRRSWNDPGSSTSQPCPPRATISESLQHPLVWLQIAVFFVYTGLEVAVGQWSFTILTEGRNVGIETAGLWVTIYWASLFAGRVLFGSVADRIGLDKMIRWSTEASLVGTVLFFLNLSNALSAFALSLTGFGLAAIFPCLMSRTPSRLGSAVAAQAIGFQVSAAMLGAAALPSAAGFVIKWTGLEGISASTVMMAAALLILHERLLRKERNKHPAN